MIEDKENVSKETSKSYSGSRNESYRSKRQRKHSSESEKNSRGKSCNVDQQYFQR